MKAKTNNKPTAREKDVLAAIRTYRKRHGMPPTHEDIAEMIGIQKPTAGFHLRNMREKGLVTWDKYKARTLRIL